MWQVVVPVELAQGKALETVRVPQVATYATTPIVSSHWSTLLAEHPDEILIRFFISRIISEFRIGFSQPLRALYSAEKLVLCDITLHCKRPIQKSSPIVAWQVHSRS